MEGQPSIFALNRSGDISPTPPPLPPPSVTELS
jgi:hypothetical protein